MPADSPMVLVQREPTEAMLVNGREALLPLVRLNSYGPLIGVWRDMLSASPARGEGDAPSERTRTLVFEVPRLDLETLKVTPRKVEIVGTHPTPATPEEHVGVSTATLSYCYALLGAGSADEVLTVWAGNPDARAAAHAEISTLKAGGQDERR